jgi:hypothetical protein
MLKVSRALNAVLCMAFACSAHPAEQHPAGAQQYKVGVAAHEETANAAIEFFDRNLH